MSNVNFIENPNSRPIYYDKATERYMQWDEQTGWNLVDQNFYDEVIENKQYIDMPNQSYFIFLNPRDIYIGINLTYDF